MFFCFSSCTDEAMPEQDPKMDLSSRLELTAFYCETPPCLVDELIPLADVSIKLYKDSFDRKDGVDFYATGVTNSAGKFVFPFLEPRTCYISFKYDDEFIFQERNLFSETTSYADVTFSP